MVFIVVLAQTYPHTPGREYSFQWNGPSVSINLIWLIMNRELLLLGLGFSFFLFSLCCVPSFVGRTDKGKGGWQKQKSDGKREVFLMSLSVFQLCFLKHHPIIDLFGTVHSLLPFICVNNEYWWLPSQCSPPGWHHMPITGLAKWLFKVQHGRHWKAVGC